MSGEPEIAIPVDRTAIEAFGRKWGIRELALFGSVVGGDFRPDSDVDVLVTFEDPNRSLGSWGNVLSEMERELERIFGRRVDLVQKRSIKNPFRRHSILTSRRIIYAA